MVAAQHLLPFLTNPVHVLLSVLLLICLAISATSFKLSFRVPVDLPPAFVPEQIIF